MNLGYGSSWSTCLWPTANSFPCASHPASRASRWPALHRLALSSAAERNRWSQRMADDCRGSAWTNCQLPSSHATHTVPTRAREGRDRLARTRRYFLCTPATVLLERSESRAEE
eukprot:53395-Prymnesium_polylepis.1